MMGGWDRWGVVDSYRGLGGGTGGGYYLLIFFVCLFLFVLLSFGFSCPVSCLREVEHDSCCLCFVVYYLFCLSPVPLTRSY